MKFCKSERIVSRKQIDELFAGSGSSSRAAFPVRAVYGVRSREAGVPAVQLLVSVPKRRLRHAVDRNRVKRQLREAYRANKMLLADAVPPDQTVSLAFVWLADRLLPSAAVETRVKHLLTGIAAQFIPETQTESLPQ